MNIRTFEPMSTRTCKYCLALQEDSVFADFEINANGCLCLIRISFDGYGCCEPETSIGEMDILSSKYLIASIENRSLESPKVGEVLSNYFRANKAVLWEDALLKHELI